MRVLFIANPESIYVKKLLENLERYGLDYGVYCCGNFFKKGFQYKILSEGSMPNNKILKFLYYKKCVVKLKEIDEYDLIHINFLDWQSILFEEIYYKRKLIVTFWGSDLYRLPRSKIYKFLQKRVLKKADIITVVHEKMIQEFYRTYKINKPIYVTPFPIPLNFRKIDEISREELEKYKESLGASNLVMVSLGYSGDPKKNHEYMIEEVAKIREDLKEKLFVVIPVTYGGSNEYIEKIKEYCKEKFRRKIKYKILTERLNEKEILLLRKATDIFINVQITDAFSASMQESLYAGNIVINGGWLDYSEIQEKGGYFETIESLESGKLKEKLEYVIDHFNELKKKTAVNKTIITNRNDWKKATERFLEIYEKALNMTKNIEKT